MPSGCWAGGEILDTLQDGDGDRKITAMRIRCHGDYHLGQVLYTGNDFMIIDFEGEPARPAEREAGSSALPCAMWPECCVPSTTPLRRALVDASMGWLVPRAKSCSILAAWAGYWYPLGERHLPASLPGSCRAAHLSCRRSRQELRVLLDAFLLEKAVYELGYELNNRPGWVNDSVCRASSNCWRRQ